MKIRNELLSQVRSYAGHTPHAAEDTLDCSLGVNPYGFPPVVKEAFAAFDPERFYHYPHSDAPQKAIVDYWADYAFIEPENIVLTDGSVSALYLLCNILAKKGAEVVGFLPTFTDMVEYSRMMAMRYVGIPARREENWRMEVSDLVDAISGDTSLVYIDRPNNPTGQTLSLADISRVLDRCEELGVYAIVDEAYGDFLPREESAVTLGPKYKNIIIVRTFSKGFGLAGLRAGYIITGQELIRYISKVSNPYMMSELSRELAAAALSDRTYADSHGPDFAAMKRSLRGVCGKELTVAVTDDAEGGVYGMGKQRVFQKVRHSPQAGRRVHGRGQRRQAGHAVVRRRCHNGQQREAQPRISPPQAHQLCASLSAQPVQPVKQLLRRIVKTHVRALKARVQRAQGGHLPPTYIPSGQRSPRRARNAHRHPQRRAHACFSTFTPRRVQGTRPASRSVMW